MNSLQGDGRTSLGENSGQSRWLRSARVCGSLDGKIPRPLQVPVLRTRRMEAGARPAAGESAPTPAEGAAAAQVGQVGSLSAGVSAAAARGSACSLAGAGRAKRALGLRIQLWEAGFVSQTLPRKKVMEAVSRSGFGRGLSCASSSSRQKAWGEAACAPRLLERSTLSCRPAHTGLAWRGCGGKRKRGVCTCPVPPWRLKGKGLRRGGVRDSTSSAVSQASNLPSPDSAPSLGVSECWSLSACPFARLQGLFWHPTPVLLPGKSHGPRTVVGCSPWGR